MFLKSPTGEEIYVSLTNGHSIRIGTEGRDVPEMFRREAFAAGAIPADMTKEEFEPPEEEQIDDSKLALLIAGIKKMLVEKPDDFTGAGLPNRKVLSAVVGWNVSVQETSVAMAKVREEAGE